MSKLTFIVLTLIFSKAFGEAYPIDTNLDGVSSIYTDKITGIVQAWPKELPSGGNKDDAFDLNCIAHPDNEFYIGVQQKAFIQAPVLEVVKVIDDFSQYSELFSDIEEVKILSNDQNKMQVQWKHKAPVFFMSSIVYELSYVTQWGLPEKRKTYRYQLKKGDQIKTSDGLIVVEKMGSGTLYSEFSFFNADWGLLKVVSPSSIWTSSVEGVVGSALNIKYKSEEPSLSFKKISEKTKLRIKDMVIQYCIKNKKNIDNFINTK